MLLCHARAAGLVVLLFLALSALAPDAGAQWSHRYPKVEGYGHHVYLEGYELPTLTSGPIDPAPAPDGSRVAFAARGWIWTLDPETGVAEQVTTGPAMDSRPAWSPDGTQIAFVRDDTRDTDVVVRTLATGAERVIAGEDTTGRRDAIDLDPHFSPEGTHLYYASARAGDIDVWRVELASGETTRLTTARGLERQPYPTPDGRGVVFLKKSRPDALAYLPLAEDGSAPEPKTLAEERIAAQGDLALAPDGHTLAYTWPHEDGYELRLLDIEAPGSSVRLSHGDARPLSPAFSADGAFVWFAIPTPNASMALRRIPTTGGAAKEVPVRTWHWAEAPGTLRIHTRIHGQPAAARLSVTDAAGHPAVPNDRMIRFDGQSGRVFYYSEGTLELPLPPGEATVSAVQGLLTPEVKRAATVASGDTVEVTLELEPVWDARGAGWASADHHFHTNYGGPYELSPGDLALDARGEALDIASPLLANLHDRFLDQSMWGYRDEPGRPIIALGQEVRSHFLGHINLLGIEELFWPWVWGPGYEVYGRDDRLNAEALQFAHTQGGLGGYVHPVMIRAPFAEEAAAEEAAGAVPLELVPDAVHGNVDLLDVACLWSDEIGTAAVWHRLLSAGFPVAANAGSDVMTNFYRTMAVGATRVYVQTTDSQAAGAPLSYRAHLEGLGAGRSFVTNGPMLEFGLEGAGPGEVVPAGEANWTLDLHAAVPVDSVQIFVNGDVAWATGGLDAPGSQSYEGALTLPEGGWVTARAYGGPVRWPLMDSYPFAETNPVWIGRVGSTSPGPARPAARELLRVLDAAEARLREGYGETSIPKLQEYFNEARARLEAKAGAAGTP